MKRDRDVLWAEAIQTASFIFLIYFQYILWKNISVWSHPRKKVISWTRLCARAKSLYIYQHKHEKIYYLRSRSKRFLSDSVLKKRIGYGWQITDCCWYKFCFLNEPVCSKYVEKYSKLFTVDMSNSNFIFDISEHRIDNPGKSNCDQ